MPAEAECRMGEVVGAQDGAPGAPQPAPTPAGGAAPISHPAALAEEIPRYLGAKFPWELWRARRPIGLQSKSSNWSFGVGLVGADPTQNRGQCPQFSMPLGLEPCSVKLFALACKLDDSPNAARHCPTGERPRNPSLDI